MVEPFLVGLPHTLPKPASQLERIPHWQQLEAVDTRQTLTPGDPWLHPHPMAQAGNSPALYLLLWPPLSLAVIFPSSKMLLWPEVCSYRHFFSQFFVFRVSRDISTVQGWQDEFRQKIIAWILCSWALTMPWHCQFPFHSNVCVKATWQTQGHRECSASTACRIGACVQSQEFFIEWRWAGGNLGTKVGMSCLLWQHHMAPGAQHHAFCRRKTTRIWKKHKTKHPK